MMPAPSPQSPSASHPQQSQSVVVSELEEQLIRACCRYQWMTVDDFRQYLAAVHGHAPTRNHVGKVVSRMSKEEYLHTFPLPKTRSGNATRVYVPGRASRTLLRQQEYADAYIFTNPATMQGYSYSFMLHNLTVSRFAIGAALYAREQKGYSLAETRLCHDMQRTPPRLSPTEREPALTVIPDLWLHIIAEDGTEYPCWIEVDRGSETMATFQRLFRARLLYIKSDQYEEYFGTRHVRLCYGVTSSKPPHEDDRLNAMLTWAEEVLKKENLHAWAGALRFTTIEYEKLYDQIHQLFSHDCWYRSDSSTPVTLFSPTTSQETPDDHATPQPNAENASDIPDAGNTFQHLPQDESPPGFPV